VATDPEEGGTSIYANKSMQLARLYKLNSSSDSVNPYKAGEPEIKKTWTDYR